MPAVSLAVSDELQRYVDRDALDFHTEIANYDEKAIQAASHVSDVVIKSTLISIRPCKHVYIGFFTELHAMRSTCV